ncbi:MAG TPA: helix-turn-helix domain-containing protein [Spirochaetota bacterium]|nr:helix-turn-helix domain-containing protein [Spirochaetota bacterium]
MENIIREELEKLGFSKLEALAYIDLVQKGAMSGYQIAKNLNVARASIYPILDSLYRKGIVSLIPGETNVYSPGAPESVLEKIKKDITQASDFAKIELSKMSQHHDNDRFINIEGYDNIINKIKELIDSAEKEIIFHTDFDLFQFENELKNASARGVRIIAFAWEKIDVGTLPIELYSREIDKNHIEEIRMMMSVDFKKTLVASNTNSRKYSPPVKTEKAENYNFIKSEFLGTFTENRLMVHVVTEHIHFDIYLMKMMKIYGTDMINENIQIKSLMEIGE